jgi:DeoR family fructose operon transcriptional repressor
MSEAAMKSEVLKRGRNKVLLCDAGKWNKPVALTFAAWSEFDFWITDADCDRTAAKQIEKQGPRVLRAPKS